MNTTLTKHLLKICRDSLNKDPKSYYNRFWVKVGNEIRTYSVQEGLVWCDKRNKVITEIDEIK